MVDHDERLTRTIYTLRARTRIRAKFYHKELTLRFLRFSPYPLRDPKGEVRVLYKVRPTRIVTFGAIPAEER